MVDTIDDAVDMIEEMPANVVNRILHNSDRETRIAINEILNEAKSKRAFIEEAREKQKYIDFKEQRKKAVTINTKLINSIIEILNIIGYPITLDEIFMFFKDKYPEHKYEDSSQIRPSMLSSLQLIFILSNISVKHKSIILSFCHEGAIKTVFLLLFDLSPE